MAYMRMAPTAALILLSAASCVFRHSATPPGAAMLPKAAREALTERWKTWSIAAVDSQATACQTAASTPAPLVSADFDNDTLHDYAAAVQTPDGVKLVALLARGHDYRVFELD